MENVLTPKGISVASNEINKQAKLSEHFTLAEMCKTSVKTADGNIPSHVHIENPTD